MTVDIFDSSSKSANSDSSASSASCNNTLWMGDLDPSMDEIFLKRLWFLLGEDVQVKLMKDKRTGVSSGYAFIGFSTPQAAQAALNNFHGFQIPIPNSNRRFHLNWASGGGICDKKEERAPEYSLFVGDLSNSVDETYLLSFFRNQYPSCHAAKIMTDPVTGASRGYAFVRFLDQLEQQEAVEHTNGAFCYDRPIRVSYATPKSNLNQSYISSPIMAQLPMQQTNNQARYMQLELQAPALVNQLTDPSNTTVFIGGLNSPVTEEQLKTYFLPFGEITYVKIPQGKGCGFVQYVLRSSAEQAIEGMNGFLVGTSRIRLSWGRSQTDKPSKTVQLSPSSTSTDTSLFGNFGSISPPTEASAVTVPAISNNSFFHFGSPNNSVFQQSNEQWLNTRLSRFEQIQQNNKSSLQQPYFYNI